jgi:hypothetical protein
VTQAEATPVQISDLVDLALDLLGGRVVSLRQRNATLVNMGAAVVSLALNQSPPAPTPTFDGFTSSTAAPSVRRG